MRVSSRCGNGPAGHEPELDGKGCRTNETSLGTGRGGQAKNESKKPAGKKRKRNARQTMRMLAMKCIENWKSMNCYNNLPQSQKQAHTYLSDSAHVCASELDVCAGVCACWPSSFMALNAYGQAWKESFCGMQQQRRLIRATLHENEADEPEQSQERILNRKKI